MSFDVFFQSFPAKAKRIDDIPDTFRPKPLGPLTAVRKALTKAVPQLRFKKGGVGAIDGEGFSAEVYLSDEDPCTSFMVALRGGPAGAAVIDAICRTTGFRAVAPGVDVIITTGSDLSEAFAGWMDYRDRVLGGPGTHLPEKKPPPRRKR